MSASQFSDQSVTPSSAIESQSRHYEYETTIEQRYRSLIEQQNNLQSTIVDYSFWQPHATTPEKISNLIRLQNYVKSFADSSNLQKRLMRNLSLMRIIKQLLGRSESEQVRLLISSLVYRISCIQKGEPLFQLVFIRHRALMKEVIMRLLQSWRTEFNAQAFAIIHNYLLTGDRDITEFFLVNDVVTKVHGNVYRLKMPSKRVLCQIICSLLQNTCRTNFNPRIQTMLTIASFLIAELPRKKSYLLGDLQQVFEQFAYFLVQCNPQIFFKYSCKIQKLLDLGLSFKSGFLKLFCWITNQLPLRRYDIKMAIQELLFMLDNEQDRRDEYFVQIVASLVLKRDQLPTEQQIQLKHVLKKLILRGITANATQKYLHTMLFIFQQLLQCTNEIFIQGQLRGIAKNVEVIYARAKGENKEKAKATLEAVRVDLVRFSGGFVPNINYPNSEKLAQDDKRINRQLRKLKND